MNQLSLNVNNDLENQSVKFQVDGKILNELSQQVTNHIFALGELIKNSYDAQATYIKITLDLKNSVLIIDDNGIGITQENMQSILHIAKSSKKYSQKFTFDIDGKKIERFTQGSKGLGLFSAFKFGNIVNWDTKYGNNDSFSLTVDKEKVTKLSNISNAIYKLETGKRVSRGTTITIKFNNNDNEILFTYKHLKEQINTKRLVNFFLDDSLTIDFNLIKHDGEIESGFPIKTIKNDDLEKEILKRNLFKINFSSKNNEVKYFYKNQIKPFDNFKYELKSNFYTIKFTIYAFIFKSGEKKLINSLFLNSRKDLAPLVYINGALFNNDNIFDPSITRKIKSSKSLSQIVGFIDITCTHSDLQFNNERTDLVFNSFNETLKDDLRNINIFIQEKGKYLEKNLPSTIEDVDLDDVTQPELDETDTATQPEPDKTDAAIQPELDKTDTAIQPEPDKTDTAIQPEPDKTDTAIQPEPDKTDAAIQPEPDKADAAIQPEPDETDIKKDIATNCIPFIKLSDKEKVIRFTDQSGIIDLKNFFNEAKDCKGNNLDIHQLKMSINGKILTSTLIPSTDQSKTLQIKFFFVDVNLKDHNDDDFICYETLTLNFQKKKFSFDPDDAKQILIEPLGYKEYKIKLGGVDRLILQINELYSNYNEFDMCISASLRLIFDLTTYRYQQLTKDELNSDALETQVERIVGKIINSPEPKHFTKVSQLLDARFKINKNTFKPGLFADKVSISNLGSHTGSNHLGAETIKDIAKYAGYYAQLVDAHCKVKGLIEK